MNRDAFEKWTFPRCLHLPRRPDGEYASVTTQEAWEAWQASRAQALEEVASLFPQPYMEYFGSDIQESIRALAQGGVK